jgi:hypothetical protein
MPCGIRTRDMQGGPTDCTSAGCTWPGWCTEKVRSTAWTRADHPDEQRHHNTGELRHSLGAASMAPCDHAAGKLSIMLILMLYTMQACHPETNQRAGGGLGTTRTNSYHQKHNNTGWGRHRALPSARSQVVSWGVHPSHLCLTLSQGSATVLTTPDHACQY